MRPIKLEMTAFGPYKDHTEIDFEKLGTGIYAITGPTGAGKTTIFDAMMFALYEQVSAQGVDSKTNPIDKNSVRNKNMVRSTFVGRDIDTVVKLKFEERGEQYIVTRTIHETPSNTNFRAELEGTDIPAIKDSKKVTNEIERILGGMDAARFRQIVMLAQGQFRAFMEAKDDKRKEILETIFDSKPYRVFQERLSKVSSRLSEKKKEKENDIRLKLRPDVFLLPEDTTEEVWALYSADLPWDILETNLEQLVEHDKQDKEETEHEIREHSTQIREWNQKLGAAGSENERYHELKEKKKNLEELVLKESEIKKRKDCLEETERAYHQVKPASDSVQTLKQEVDHKKEERKEKEEEIRTASEAKAAAQEEQSKNEERQREAQELERKAEKIREHLGDFEGLADAEAKLRAADQAIEKANSDIRQAQKKQEAIQEELGNINAALEDLKDAGIKEKDAQNTYAKASDFLKQLKDPKTGVLQFALLLREEENHLHTLWENAKKAEIQAGRAAEEYHRIHQRYLNSYAGKLGVELEKELEEKETAYCPVCNQVFHKGEAHTFAGSSTDSVTDEDLKNAEEKKVRAENTGRSATDAFTGARGTYNSNKEHLIQDLDRLLSQEGSWEWDKENTIAKIKECIAKAVSEVKKCEETWNTATAAVKRKQDFEKRKEQLEKTEKETITKISDRNVEKGKAEGDQSRYKAEAERLKGELEKALMLQYVDKGTAETAMQQMLVQKETLEKAIKTANDRLQVLTETLKALNGAKQQQDKYIEEKQKAYEGTFAEYVQIREKQGFPDEETYQQAIRRVDRMEPEQWIKAEREAINRYHQYREQTQSRIRELEKNPPKYTDLEVLQGNLNRLEEEQRTLQKKEHTLQNQAASHVTALETLQKGSKELEIMDSAYQRIVNLAGAANGETSSYGKRSFDGYVLGSTFREVLDHASYYLDEMTGGKYSLCHDTEASGVRKNASANFVIMVQDKLTEVNREIGTLSGGESFQAAMALALGLSDTVQSHVSTVSIDTMFIDEGFGTLDSTSLQRMLKVLTNMSDGSRQIGIVSHVDELKESIGKFIHVTASKDDKGSHLRIEV